MAEAKSAESPKRNHTNTQPSTTSYLRSISSLTAAPAFSLASHHTSSFLSSDDEALTRLLQTSFSVFGRFPILVVFDFFSFRSSLTLSCKNFLVSYLSDDED